MDANPLRDFLDNARTEPLTLGQLGDYFDCNRNCMRDVVLPTLDYERVGVRYRIRLACMPPRYLVDVGVLQSFATNRNDAEVTTSIVRKAV